MRRFIYRNKTNIYYVHSESKHKLTFNKSISLQKQSVSNQLNKEQKEGYGGPPFVFIKNNPY